MRQMILALCLLLNFANPVMAATAKSPKQIVQTLYKPYLADPRAEKLGGPSALDLILPYASKSLKAAIQKNAECERREQDICAIDFDIIINGQDWNLSRFDLSNGVKNSLPVVTATFHNGGRNKVNYFFVNEKGTWKIDEVEAIHYNADGSVESRYKLKQELKRSW